jgi:hypothetical protein
MLGLAREFLSTRELPAAYTLAYAIVYNKLSSIS